MTSGSRRSVICCLFGGVHTVALSQKPGGKIPASGAAAARRSISSSLISRNALLRGFGGGMSSRLSYLTMPPRFLVVLAVIPVGLPRRDNADVAITLGKYEPNYFAVIFAKRDEAPFTVLAPSVLGDQHIAAEYF